MPTASLRDLLRFMRREKIVLEGSASTDGALLERFLARRDEAAFELLLQRHGTMVLGVCQRVVGDPHAAEDAFQATFLVLARRAGSIRDHASVGAWLYGVAQRIAMRARAQAATRRQRERQAADMAHTKPDDALTCKELRSVLDEEVARLPEKYRAAVVLCHLEGKSYDAAARELGWPKTSLASRLAKAHELLRTQLTRRGFALPAAAIAAALAENATASSVAALSTINIVKAAMSVAAGKAIADGLLSAHALALAEQATKSIFGKGKLALLLVTLGLIAGAAYVGYSVWTAPRSHPPDAKQPAMTPQPAINDIPGDPLPPGAIVRMGQDRWMHDPLVRFAEFLPDGKRIVTLSEDRTIRVWEFPSGKPIHRINLPVEDRSIAPAGDNYKAALSKDGKTLATWCPEDASAIQLHDLESGKTLPSLKLPPPGAKVKGPGGVTGRHRVTDVVKLAFSPDGRHLADGSRNWGVRIWDMATSREVSFPAGHAISSGYLVGYAPDASLVTTYGGAKITFWSPDTGEEIRTIRVPVAPRSLAFSPSGKLLAVTSGGMLIGPADPKLSVVIVDTATGKEIRTMPVPEGWVSRLYQASGAFGKDDTRFYLHGYSGDMAEFDVATGNLLRGGGEKPRSIGSPFAVSPDGQYVVGIGVGPPFHDLSGKDITPLDSISPSLFWLAFTPDGSKLLTLATGTGDPIDEAVRWYDAATGKELGKLTGKEFHKGALAGVGCTPSALCPNGKFLAAFFPAEFGQGKRLKPATIVLVDVATREELRRLPAEPLTGPISFSPDSKMLAVVGERGGIELYRVPDAKLLQTIEKANGSVVFSRDGKMLAAHADADTLGIWDTVTGKRIGSLPIWGGGGYAFSADARCLATEMNDGTAAVYELAAAQPRWRFGKKRSAPPPALRISNHHLLPDEFKAGSCFAFSPDSRLLVRARLGILHVYDIQSRTELAAFKGHDGAVTAVAFAPNGKTLASAGMDSTALVWDVAKLKPPAAPPQTLEPADLERHWHALADNDATKAFDSIGALIGSPKEAVAWIKDRVKPARLDVIHVTDLIARLDAEFEVRDKAASDLAQLGEQAVPVLDKALAANPAFETKLRLEMLRGKLTGLLLQGETLRDYRAVEVLEQIGTPEARAVLQTLAGGAPGARVTTSAQAALKR
jgi:RNA polymerase sigma factor (sigma-70 family)